MEFKEIDLKEYFKTFYRNRKVFFIVLSFIFIFTAVFTFLTPKTYEAKTTIYFPSIGSSGGMVSFAGISLPMFGGSKGDNGSGSGSSMPTTIVDNLSGKMASATYAKVVMQSKKIKLELARELDLYNKYHVKSDEQMAQRVTLSTNINVNMDDLMTITTRAESPDLAALMANKYVELVRKYHAESKLGTAKKRKIFLESQIVVKKKELENLEKEMQNFIAQYKIFDIESYNQNIQASKNTLEKEKSSNNIEIDTLQKSLDNMKKELISQARLSKADFTQFNAITDSELKQIRQELISKRINLNAARAGRTDQHSAVVKLKQEVSVLENFYRQQLEKYIKNLNSNFPVEFVDLHIDYSIALARREAVKKNMEENDKYIAGLPKVILQYMDLRREYESKKMTYVMFQQDLESTRISEAQEVPNLEVLDAATPPEGASYPKIKSNLIIGLLFGILFGIIAAFIWEYIDKNVINDIIKKNRILYQGKR